MYTIFVYKCSADCLTLSFVKLNYVCDNGHPHWVDQLSTTSTIQDMRGGAQKHKQRWAYKVHSLFYFFPSILLTLPVPLARPLPSCQTHAAPPLTDLPSCLTWKSCPGDMFFVWGGYRIIPKPVNTSSTPPLLKYWLPSMPSPSLVLPGYWPQLGDKCNEGRGWAIVHIPKKWFIFLVIYVRIY